MKYNLSDVLWLDGEGVYIPFVEHNLNKKINFAGFFGIDVGKVFKKTVKSYKDWCNTPAGKKEKYIMSRSLTCFYDDVDIFDILVMKQALQTHECGIKGLFNNIKEYFVLKKALSRLVQDNKKLAPKVKPENVELAK